MILKTLHLFSLLFLLPLLSLSTPPSLLHFMQSYRYYFGAEIKRRLSAVGLQGRRGLEESGLTCPAKAKGALT